MSKYSSEFKLKAENFFSLLKLELFYMKKHKTIEELERNIIEYIDYYNNKG